MVAAAVLVDGAVRTVEVELRPPGPGEVRVATTAAGVCGLDRAALSRGGPARVLGHEAVGVVDAVGEGVERVAVGDPVLVTSQWACGSCPTCVRGEPTLCTTAAAGVERHHATLDGAPLAADLATGALAAATVVDASAVHRLPEGVPPAHAVLFSCALPTGLGAVRNVARAWPGERVVVLGAGAVGLAAVQASTLAGAVPVVVAEPDAGRRGLAVELGAGRAVVPGEVGAAVAEATHDAGADHVVVATGDPAAVAAALALVRPGGTVVLVGRPRGGLAALDAADVATRGVRVLGTARGAGSLDADVPQLLELALDRRLVLDELVGDDLALADVPDHLAAPASGAPRRLVRFED